jgi:hypothetical protein
MPSRWARADAITLVIGTAVITGLALRAVGLSYGLPAVYNPDEVAIMNRTLSLTQNGLNPHNFLYPSLYFYVLLAWEGMAFAAGRLTGLFDSVAAFERSFFTDPSYIFRAGRWFSVLCGTATIWAIASLGARLRRRWTGAAAAWLLAVAPLAVRDAHYVKHDVPVTLLIVVTHLALAAWLDRPSPGRLVLTAVLAGLAMSTHYYAVFLAVPLVLVLGSPVEPERGIRRPLARLGLAGVVAGGAFVLTSPFLVVEPMTALRDVIANREIVVDRATASTGAFGSFAFYGRWLSVDALGGMSFVLALFGLLLVPRLERRRVSLLLAFPVSFLLFIANTFPASRYLNPLLPFVALLAAVAATPEGGRMAVRVGAAALTIAVAQGSWNSIRVDQFFRQTDTRTLARDWFERNVPAETTVLVQPYSVPLTTSRTGLAEALAANLGSVDRATVKFQRQLALDPYPAPAYRTIFLGVGGTDADKIYISPRAFDGNQGLAPLRALSVTHVILKRYNVDDPSLASLVEALGQEGRLLTRLSPYAADSEAAGRQAVPPFLHNADARILRELERPGPIIEIWTMN